MNHSTGAPSRLGLELDRNWLQLTLVAWLAVTIWFVVNRWGQIHWLGLGDTDDNMRLMQVRALLNGQGVVRSAPVPARSARWIRHPLVAPRRPADRGPDPAASTVCRGGGGREAGVRHRAAAAAEHRHDRPGLDREARGEPGRLAARDHLPGRLHGDDADVHARPHRPSWLAARHAEPDPGGAGRSQGCARRRDRRRGERGIADHRPRNAALLPRWQGRSSACAGYGIGPRRRA